MSELVFPFFNQKAVDGIEFDFNDGLRFKFPPNLTKEYKIVLENEFDREINSFVINPKVLYKQSDNKGFIVRNDYYTLERKNIKIFDNNKNKILFNFKFSLKGKRVLIYSDVQNIGDNFAWIGIYEKFRQENKCDLYLCIDAKFSEYFKHQYKEINFIKRTDISSLNPFITFRIDANLKVNSKLKIFSICDFGVQNFVYNFLGMDFPERGKEEKPKLNLSHKRKIKEKYVVISNSTFFRMKLWQYPNGWETVTKYIKDLGYRVIQLGLKDDSSTIKECEDFRKELELQEIIDLIKDADFFVGLSSGLSWVSWACNVPTVMISGFTTPTTEFETPYRIYPKFGCRFCQDFPIRKPKIYKEDDSEKCDAFFEGIIDKKFECQYNIHPKMVIDKINQIPCVKEILENDRKN